MPIRFQRSTKRSFAFTSLTLGTAGPSEICLTGTGAGKSVLRKHSSKLFESQHFESLYRTICNKYLDKSYVFLCIKIN